MFKILKDQIVEHENLLRKADISVSEISNNKYVTLEDTRHKVYPTGNEKEPWTTNISYMKVN